MSSEFVKYTVVGTVSTLVTWFVFWLFADVLGYKALLVAIIFTPISFVFRFFADKNWVFIREAGE